MGRRVVAMITLLVAAVVLQVALPHSNPPRALASAAVSTESADADDDGPEADTAFGQASPGHPEGSSTPVGLVRRNQPLAARGAVNPGRDAATAAPSGPPDATRASAARERWSPVKGGAAGHAASQTLRC